MNAAKKIWKGICLVISVPCLALPLLVIAGMGWGLKTGALLMLRRCGDDWEQIFYGDSKDNK